MRILRAIVILLILLGTGGLYTPVSHGQNTPQDTPRRYASIVVDADSLEIIHARQIDGPRFPASLTKVMTLYLTFEALNSGKIKMSDRLLISPHAARIPPVGLGLRTGQHMSVDKAIRALTVRSANDAAVVLAERLGGSEENFARMMTQTARTLGMQNTIFRNASGLPDPDQRTTARDMAKLASAVLNHHRSYYYYFGLKSFTYNGRSYQSTNKLLGTLPGTDGFKTGYTRDSGYNLIISTERPQGRLIAVVLGGATGQSRNQHMTDLIERGFDVLGRRTPKVGSERRIKKEPIPIRQQPLSAHFTAGLAPTPKSDVVTLRRSDQSRTRIPVTTQASANLLHPDVPTAHWQIQIGAFDNQALAQAHLARLTQADYSTHTGLGFEHAHMRTYIQGAKTLYQARFIRLSPSRAQEACKTFKSLNIACFVISGQN